MRERTLYFAYGANLNRRGMKARCPGSRPLRTFELLGHELVFRGVADVVPAAGKSVAGALYEISEADERSLDRFEGFNRRDPRKGMYRKEYFEVRNRATGEICRVMYYVMNRGDLCGPSRYYLETILQGYTDWGLDPSGLLLAADTARASLSARAAAHG